MGKKERQKRVARVGDTTAIFTLEVRGFLNNVQVHSSTLTTNEAGPACPDLNEKSVSIG